MSTDAQVVGPGEGIRYEMIDGVHVRKAGVEDSSGGFEVFEVEASRGPAAPPHASPWHGVLYVLSGELRVDVDGSAHRLVPGAAITLPARVPCTFAVTSPSARFLAITSASGAGRFFADFARSVPADRPVAELLPDILAVTRRHGVGFAAAP